jgi:FG-GAP-like repeat
MRHTRSTLFRYVLLWVCALSCLIAACSETSSSTDVGRAPDASSDAANDLSETSSDAIDDASVVTDAREEVDTPVATDLPPPGCVPGMSISCACTDGRMGAQVCLTDRTYGMCLCTGPVDASTPDVVLPPLGARLLAPQSVSRVTSRRPTMRWVLPEGVTRARVEVCGDRPCTRVLLREEVTGTSWRPSTMLSPGVAWWRVRGLDGDGGVAWSSATWEFVVGHRDAPIDTSFGTLRDIDGDGYDDITAVRGLASLLVYRGRSTMGSTDPSMTIDLHDNGAALFQYCDFNGDGFADLPLTTGAGNPIDVRLGGREGLPQDPSISVSQPGNQYFPMAITCGDTNGDGFSDLVVTSAQPPFDLPLRHFDLRVYFGSSTGLNASPSAIVSAPDGYYADDIIPELFAGEDVNADGFSDILTASPILTSPSLSESRAWILAGHDVTPLQTWVPISIPPGARHFGIHMAGVGDLNGDGVSDYAAHSDLGVHVYLGHVDSFSTTPFRTIADPSERPCGFRTFGAPGKAGDYNGDGRADLLVTDQCAPDTPPFLEGPGTVYLYNGTSMGFSETVTTFRGALASAGIVGLGVGDFDGDGIDDLAFLQGGASGAGGTLLTSINVMLGSVMGVSWDRRWTFYTGGVIGVGIGGM